VQRTLLGIGTHRNIETVSQALPRDPKRFFLLQKAEVVMSKSIFPTESQSLMFVIAKCSARTQNTQIFLVKHNNH